MDRNPLVLTATFLGTLVASCHSSTTPMEAIVGGCGVVNETATFRPFVIWGESESDESRTMVLVVPSGCGSETCSNVRGYEFDSLSIPPVDSPEFPRAFDTIYAAVVDGPRPDVRVRSGRSQLSLEGLTLDGEIVFDDGEGPPRRFHASHIEVAMFCPRVLPPG
jgi:hypothetical protein